MLKNTLNQSEIEKNTLRKQLNLALESRGPEDLNVQLRNTRDLLKETQDQLKSVEEHNKLLQGKVGAKIPPRARLHKQLLRLRKVVQDKDLVLKEANSKIPKVVLNIEGITRRELKNINLRKKIFELINSANNTVHVHINDETIVDISDENIKNNINALLKKGRKNKKDSNNLKRIIILLEELKNINRSTSDVNVHLNDEMAVKLVNNKIKNKLIKLIAQSESIVDNTTDKVSSLQKLFNNQLISNEFEEGDGNEDDDEYDEEYEDGNEEEEEEEYEEDEEGDEEEDEEDDEDDDEEDEDDEDEEVVEVEDDDAFESEDDV